MSKNLLICKLQGGFGNQLFQYATAYAISKRANLNLEFDLSFFEIPKFKTAWRLNMLNIDIQIAKEKDINNLKNCTSPINFFNKVILKLKLPSKYKKTTHYINNSVFQPKREIYKIKESKYIEGWFVQPSYFIDYKLDLLCLFQPKFKLSESFHKKRSEITSVNSVSVHVRRNDYIGNKIFRNLDLDYYNTTMKILKKKIPNVKFFIFSDDIKWCMENFICKNDLNFVDTKNENSDLEDFFLMKACNHNIIANSSYSWWAAFLNENSNKTVFAPKVWYKDVFFQNNLERNPDFLQGWNLI